MISQKAKYALRALLALSHQAADQPLLIAEIARRNRIPRKFLEQILLELKHHGLVASRRGQAGGYLLLRPAADLPIGEVLRLIDGPLAPLPCLSKMAYRPCADCQDVEQCEIRRVFAEVAAATRAILERRTVADLAAPDGGAETNTVSG